MLVISKSPPGRSVETPVTLAVFVGVGVGPGVGVASEAAEA
jgi:hypothetical protein